MSTKSEPELWKLIGGGAIILVAFGIMMPGIFDYVGRLGRVAAMVLIALAIALTFVFVTRKLFKRPANGGALHKGSTTGGETTPAEKLNQT